jgi:neutral amino acid transport system permease protein
MENFVVSLVIFTCVYAIFGLGLNLQWGYTGLLNFGHVAFMTVGAYATVLLTLGGVPLAIAALIGGALAALLGLLIGISTLRLRTDYLAIVTIGVAEVIRLIAVNEEWLTRGTFGIQKFPLPLATFNPGPFGRLIMIAILTTVLGLSYCVAVAAPNPKAGANHTAAARCDRSLSLPWQPQRRDLWGWRRGKISQKC